LTGKPLADSPALMGSIKIASQGPQNHQPSQEEIQSQFKKHLITAFNLFKIRKNPLEP